METSYYINSQGGGYFFSVCRLSRLFRQRLKICLMDAFSGSGRRPAFVCFCVRFYFSNRVGEHSGRRGMSGGAFPCR